METQNIKTTNEKSTKIYDMKQEQKNIRRTHGVKEKKKMWKRAKEINKKKKRRRIFMERMSEEKEENRCI